MKDNFSTQSDEYAKYRPTYPAQLFEYLFGLIATPQTAWDCGTGNGQVAFQLAKHFQQVFATDISQQQLQHAAQSANITYSVQPAEHTNFADNQFHLIVVAQAIHWFHFEAFYAEVKRTAKPNAILCVLGYSRPTIAADIDALVTGFYTTVVGPYWDTERHYIDEQYQTIPFPFPEIEAPAFTNKMDWSFDHFIGYLQTWSAVKHFVQQRGYNPVDALKAQLEPVWNEQETRTVTFPLLLRLGRIVK